MRNRDSNKAILMTIMVMASFFNTFMGASINMALPRIAGEFSLSASHLSWLAISFLLSSAMFLVPMGKVSDIVGRKKIFVVGNVVFGLSSVMCSISPDAFMLVIMRFVQGVGSAMIQSTGMAIIAGSFAASDRGKMIGFNVSAVYLGLTLAPFLGGYLTEVVGWRSLFYINVLASFVIIILTILKIRGDEVLGQTKRFDWMGTVVFMLVMLSLVVGLSGFPRSYSLWAVLLCVMFAVLFVVIETKALDPIVPLGVLWTNKPFFFSNVAALILEFKR